MFENAKFYARAVGGRIGHRIENETSTRREQTHDFPNFSLSRKGHQ